MNRSCGTEKATEGLYAHPAVRKVNQQTLGTEGFQTQDVLEKKQLWGQGKCQWPPWDRQRKGKDVRWSVGSSEQ